MNRLSAALAGRYRIERELGQGGMATVYLAHDLRHERQVALKVLRPDLAAVIGASRFLHEIKTTANLQHPHILPLHDSGEVDGTVFYVMPYIEGESLRDRLVRDKQLPVDEAVRIAVEVAGALEHAHQRKVIHRDIKPENILLQGDHALVADFGIALAAAKTEGGSRMTETGMSLGTPHYMSPEQAMGEREISARSDVYALGCVLYELLTGEPPFTGPTAQAIVARVLTEDPRSLTLQRRSIPPHVEAAVLTALAKLPADRFASAAQFGLALGNPAFVGTTTTRAVVAVAPKRRNDREFLLGGLAVAALTLLAWQTLRPRAGAAAPPITRFTLQYEFDGRISDAAGSPIAVSPDGSRIVYVGMDSSGANRWLYTRRLDDEAPVRIAGTRDAIAPFFSPDGSRIGFQQEGMIRHVGIAGGAVVTTAETPSNSATWAPDSSVYFTLNTGIYRVPAAGGTPARVATADTTIGEALRWPDALPDGSGVLLTRVVSGGASTLAYLSLPDGKLHDLGQSGTYPRWVTGGYVAFIQSDGTLFAARFDRNDVRLVGVPVPIVGGIRLGPAAPGKLGLSRSGTVAFLGADGNLRELVIAARSGGLTVLPGPSQFYARPRFSPDGRRIAYQVLTVATSLGADVWITDLATANASRITFDTASSDPTWTPEGRRLVYKGRRGTLYRITVDGSGVVDSLLARPNRSTQELIVTPDGTSLLYRDSDPAGRTGADVWLVRLDSADSPRPILRTPFSERGIALSPDGKWLAFTSN